MKKIIKLEGLCCANCAAKIEEGVKKLDGVNSASLSFMTQRLIMEVEDGREEEPWLQRLNRRLNLKCFVSLAILISHGKENL